MDPTLKPAPGQRAAPAGQVFEKARLGPALLRNRFIKAATFEGLASENVVNEALIDFHRRIAEGGVGMTTIAYCAVSPDGQGAPNEILVDSGASEGLGRFVEAIHETGAAASIQLGHAGPVGAGAGQKGLSPSRVFAPQALRFTRKANEADIERVIGDFARAGRVAADAGFDALELHFGHGYLVSAFLSPSLNRRKDAWGKGTVTGHPGTAPRPGARSDGTLRAAATFGRRPVQLIPACRRPRVWTATATTLKS